MGIYEVTDGQGRTLEMEGPRPPTEEEIREAFDYQSPASRLTDFAKDVISPPTEDIPELPYYFQGDEEPALKLYQAKDPTAVATQDEHGNVVFEGEKGRVYPDKPGFTLRDIPQFLSDARDVAIEAGPLLAGGAITAPIKALPAMAVMGATGAASKLAGDTAEGQFDPAGVAIEGGVSMLGEGVGRTLLKIGGNILSRLKKPNVKLTTESGELTEASLKTLEDARLDPKLRRELEQELAGMTRTGALTREEAERANMFIKHGMQPTKANVTRKATDWMEQQELSKQSGQVLDVVQGQEKQLYDKLGAATEYKGGGNALESVRNQVDEADNIISGLYAEARAAAPTDRVVSFPTLAKALKKSQGQESISGGVYSAVRGQMRDMGLLDKKFRAVGKTTVEQAEELRKFLNRLSRSATPEGQYLIGQLKNSLDDDVFRVFGDDMFKQARAAKSALETKLDRARVGRRDRRSGEGILRDIVSNKVDPDDYVKSMVLSKKYRASDLKELKQYLKSIDDTAAWDQLRKDTLMRIRAETFKGPQTEIGIKKPTRNRMDTALKQIGEEKLNVLFTPRERTAITDVKKLLEYMEPTPGQQQGRGPSAQAVEKGINRLIQKLPSAEIVVSLFDDSLRKALNPLVDTLRGLSRVEQVKQRKAIEAQIKAVLRQYRPVGGVLAAAATAEAP